LVLEFFFVVPGGKDFYDKIRRTQTPSLIQFALVANDADIWLYDSENVLVVRTCCGNPNIKRRNINLTGVSCQEAVYMIVQFTRYFLMDTARCSRHLKEPAFDDFHHLVQLPGEVIRIGIFTLVGRTGLFHYIFTFL